jgi:Fic family protein
MFEPKFKYTDKMVNQLLVINSAKEFIDNARIVPKWDIALRREAIIKGTHASTAIEGNPLTLSEVEILSKGRNVFALEKEKREVLNYINVLEHINRYIDKNKITERSILRLHKDLIKGTLDNHKFEGKYRDIQVFVGNRFTGEIHFTPPSVDNVSKMMKGLIKWINDKETDKLNPPVAAGIIHYQIVYIHPFIDGNGRTARALATLILVLKGYNINRYFTLDDYYNGDRKAYYNALRVADISANDLSGWLEYFLEGFMISIMQVKQKIMTLGFSKYSKKREKQIALTNREMKILELIYGKGRITSGDLQKLYGITRQAVHKELRNMIKKGVIVMRGSGKTTYYTLNKVYE